MKFPFVVCFMSLFARLDQFAQALEIDFHNLFSSLTHVLLPTFFSFLFFSFFFLFFFSFSFFSTKHYGVFYMSAAGPT